MRLVLLQIGDEKVQQERFSCSRAPENHGVGYIAVVQVQEVGCVVVRFENRQIFLPEMAVLMLATVKGKEKRIIGIVGVHEIEGAEIEGIVAGNGGKKRVQKVVLFLVKLCVVDAEDLIELGGGSFHSGWIEVINHNGE